MIRTTLTALGAAASAALIATPAVAHPGHDPIMGTLHAIAHELGGLDILLTAVTLGVVAALVARPVMRKLKERRQR